jgi:hypothetical protein
MRREQIDAGTSASPFGTTERGVCSGVERVMDSMRQILQGRDGRLFGWVAGLGSLLLLPLLWARWATVSGYGVLPGVLGSSPTGPIYRDGPTVALNPFRDGFVVPPLLVATALGAVLMCAVTLAAGRSLRARIGAGAGLLGTGAGLLIASIGQPAWILPAGQLHGLPSCMDGGLPCAIWSLETAQQLLPAAAAILMACGAAGAIRTWRWATIERSAAAATSTRGTHSDAAVLALLIAAACLTMAILAITNLALHPFTF